MRSYNIFIISLAFITALQAGTTGKIKGKVVDGKTGEALSGANVLIAGTTMGASAGLDGFFIILNIPPGKYKLQTSYIGYKNSAIEIHVNVDLTTNQNFMMTEQAITAS